MDHITAALPARHGPGDAIVTVVHWPEDRARAAAGGLAGVPMLLLVAPEAGAPPDWDVLTDWIRLPADEQDIRTRVEVLARRARRRPPPTIDEFGVVWRGDAWVALSPVEARLLRVLLDEPGHVLSRRSLAARAWPDGTSSVRIVDSYVKRLRRRIPPVGLSIHTVRQRGYLLSVDSGAAPATEGNATAS